MGLSMTKAELAELTGLDYKQVFNADKSLPEDKKLYVPGEEKRKYDLATFVQRWTEYNVNRNKPSDELSATKIDIGRIAGYSCKQLNRIDAALEDDDKLFVKCEDGKYDLAFFVQHWVRYQLSKADPDNDRMDLELVKAKHEVVKTQKTELEVARMKGRLIDVQDVRKLWGDVVATVVQNFLNLPSKTAPLVRMMDNTEAISGIMEQEIRKVLENLSETPLPEYAEVNDEEPESEEEDEGEV